MKDSRAKTITRSRRLPPTRPITRAVVLLDSRIIREEALAAYCKTERELAKATSQLKRYNERDIPGFKAWCRRTFGKLFIQLQDLEASLHAKQAMAREIRLLIDRFELTEAEAFRKYLWRRDNPQAAEEEDRKFEDQERRRQAEAEAAKLKRKAEAEAEGIEPEEEEPDLGDGWDDMEDLFSAFLGSGKRKRKAAAGADTTTARELYRTIVRKLHPDHHGHMSETRKHLWDEAQTAWRTLDVETLKNVLAQCETEDITVGNQTAISTIMQATRRIQDALKQSKRQIRQLTLRLEWNYETRKTNPAYARKVENVILDEIRLIRFQLDRLTRALEALEQSAAKKIRKRPAKSANAKR